MDKKEEQKLLKIVAGLMNTVNDIRVGQQLMTDAFILLERRMNELESAQKPKSSIIIPKPNVASVLNGKTN